MKCKKCRDEINLTVFGMPNDICWGCLQEPEEEIVLDKNMRIKQYKPDLDRYSFSDLLEVELKKTGFNFSHNEDGFHNIYYKQNIMFEYNIKDCDYKLTNTDSGFNLSGYVILSKDFLFSLIENIKLFN